MNLLKLEKVSLAYGHHPLLDQVDLQIDAGERVCLIGRNGTGKSSLMKLICAQQLPDDGHVRLRAGTRVAYLEQDVPADASLTVFELVASGLGEAGELIRRYHDLAQQVAEEPSDALMAELACVQQRLDTEQGWSLNQRVETVISKLSLDAETKLAALSGGLRRRVNLAKALVTEPELLLLDEPTNHLDISSITWLEEFLLAYPGTLIFITHDRSFLRNLATRIIELDRGILRSYPGDLDNYYRRKEQELAAEEAANKNFDKKLAQEEQWIRQGIKARRTRNEGRVRALQAMRKERNQRRERQHNVDMQRGSAEKTGKLVADLRGVSFSYGGKAIIKNLSTRILRGDRIGIIGDNGTGKSTLLKLILGQLEPQQGEVVLGTKLQIAYYDQQRDQLAVDQSVKDNVNDGHDFVTVGGKSRHVISYLKDFLFPAEKINTPVKALSGGERNRLLLAKAFLQPANLLVLDEPTNDLDVETLELLEEFLLEFDGTLLLVSHDRSFLDNVVTSTLVFEGEGHVQEFVGGYEDWLRQAQHKDRQESKQQVAIPADTKTGKSKQAAKKKLSYHVQRELEQLPELIESLESEKEQLQQHISEPQFYQQDPVSIKASLDRVAELDAELEAAYLKWEMLDQA